MFQILENIIKTRGETVLLWVGNTSEENASDENGTALRI